MSTEYGVFNDEGCIAREYGSLHTAERAAAAMRDAWDRDYAGEHIGDADADPNAYAAALCPDHDEQPADSCEDCGAEDDET